MLAYLRAGRPPMLLAAVMQEQRRKRFPYRPCTTYYPPNTFCSILMVAAIMGKGGGLVDAAGSIFPAAHQAQPVAAREFTICTGNHKWKIARQTGMLHMPLLCAMQLEIDGRRKRKRTESCGASAVNRRNNGNLTTCRSEQTNHRTCSLGRLRCQHPAASISAATDLPLRHVKQRRPDRTTAPGSS